MMTKRIFPWVLAVSKRLLRQMSTMTKPRSLTEYNRAMLRATLAFPGMAPAVFTNENVRGLLGADSSTGAIEIGDVVEVGATVQFQVRDAAGADKDLRLAVERAGAELQGRPVGALLFTCNGRGRRMFGVPDHDASTIEALLGEIPLAGFFAAGEIGPIAGRNALHAFTASMALFIDDTV